LITRGIRKPVLWVSDGSGCWKYGTQAIGTPIISRRASS